jgi:hypothetical protein
MISIFIAIKNFAPWIPLSSYLASCIAIMSRIYIANSFATVFNKPTL